MKIGVLTFFKSANYGANLQALSTYNFLKKKNYNPVFMQYMSEEYEKQLFHLCNTYPHYKVHIDFVNKYIENQSVICHNANELNQELHRLEIEKLIIGSDAVLQHHSFLSRIHRGKRKPLYIEAMTKERLFPNIFWGVGLDNNIEISLMSVSSQNSDFNRFSKRLKKHMAEALEKFSYISVRDKWTQKMLCTINGKIYPITPDPVFAFNYNAAELIPSKNYILDKYHLPSRYILISLMSQSLSIECLNELNFEFTKLGYTCVVLPMPTGKGFSHKFEYEIPNSLCPLDWYALIKYSSGYIGSNMHPIVVALHNGIPCFSIDFWGQKDFFNRPINNDSSKVLDIMRTFGIDENHRFISGTKCDVKSDEIIKGIINFPIQKVKCKADNYYKSYLDMMNNMMSNFKNEL